MNILFVHTHFPGQFRYLAEFFGKAKDNQTVFATTETARKELQIPGVKKIIIAEKSEDDDQKLNPLKSPPAIALANLLVQLKKQEFAPDIIIGQSGSGMSLYVKDVFPQTPFLSFFEWYHNPATLQQGFESGSEAELKALMNLRNKNMPVLADLAACDAGICPTLWQKSQFPKEFQDKLTLVHDGIDTSVLKPSPDTKFQTDELDLSKVKQLVTYAANLLAPYAGFDQFMDALPKVLENKPDAHVVILGADRFSIADKDGNKKSYKSVILERVTLDKDRIHFIDTLPYEKYITLLQASSVHIYLDSPLVVSRPLLEAMACGCLVLASDILPVKEVIKDGANGILADFSSTEKIAEKIINCLDFPSFMEKIKEKARQTIVDGYSLEKTIPAQLAVIKKLTQKQPAGPKQFG